MATRSRDSRQSVQVRIELLTTDASGRETVANLPAHEFFQSLSVEFTDAAGWAATLVLFDAERKLEVLLLTIGSQRFMRFWWGFEDDDIDSNAPRYLGFITKAVPTFAVEGLTFTIDVVVSGMANDALNKDLGDKFGVAGDRVSLNNADARGKKGIVQQLAEALRWPFSTDTIEDFPTILAEARSADGNETALSFIQRLAAETVSDLDRHPVVFFDAEGKLHFRTPEYAADRRKQPGATYLFGRDAWGEVLSFQPEDLTFFSVLTGSGNALWTSFPSLSGKQRDQPSQQSALEGAARAVLSDSKFVGEQGIGRHAQQYLTGRDLTHLTAVAKAAYSRLSQHNYSMSLSVIGTHALVKGGLVTVDYVTANGEKHFLSGTFYVEKLTHSVSSDGWKTDISGSRPGIGGEEGAVALQADATIPINGVTPLLGQESKADKPRLGTRKRHVR